MTTILLIEDERLLLEEIALMLSFEGFDVLQASTGAAGVALALEHHPDLVISDIMLPGMDGHAVLLALQDDPATRSIPFIFLTAKADPSNIRQGMNRGADDYITKPFTRDDLLAAIRTRLSMHEAVAETYQRKLDDLRRTLTLILPHELRTPLTSLMGYAEMLMQDSATLETAQIVEMATMMHSAGLRLQRQVENFLLYAQYDRLKSNSDQQHNGQHVATPQPETVIATVAQRTAARAGRTDDLQVTLGNAALSIPGDSLEKIVDELVDNACKFSAAGSPVQVRADVTLACYTLRVIDQGNGMQPEQIRNAGQYMQFERRMHDQQGAGLGLALVHLIAQVEGGDVTITSTPEQGTTVAVRLPVAVL